MASSNDLKKQFEGFSKFGNSKSDGTTITLSQCDKWMKQANVIDGKHVTTTDTGICFNKLKSKTINFNTFEKYVQDLAQYKKLNADDLFKKLIDCGEPGTSGTTGISKTGAVDRLTDPSKYTGSHKQRFDSSGKGRGIEGRADISDDAGYVQGYKEKDTYDKKHPK